MKASLGLCAFFLASSASARSSQTTTPISGHDFDFDVLYPSGLSFSTSNPPTEPLSLDEIQNNATLPQMTLRDFGNASERYLSFALVTYIRPNRNNASLIIRTPYLAWIRANQTISEDGTLGGGGSDENNGQSLSVLSELGEFKNATLHVWQQTQNVTDYLFKNNVAQALDTALGDLWSNSTWFGDPPPYVGYDFPRANIDFDVRNVTNTTTGNGESSTASHSILSSPVMAAFCLIAMCLGL